MADGSVRGTFELNAEQPIRELRSIRDAAVEVDTTLDSVGRRMDALGRRTARPRIVLQGFDRVNAQLSELEARLDRLDRRRAIATVGTRRSLTSDLMGGGRGSLPLNNQAGGGGLPLFSSLGGIGGRLPWWALAAPLAPQLLGGAGALVGSAGSATLGAGAVGLGGLGALAAGGIPSALIGQSAVKSLQGITKAQTQYNDALKAFGSASTQAAAAKRRLDLALVNAPPGAAGAARQVSALTSDFRRATRPAYTAMYTGIAQGAASIRGALPTLGPLVNTSAGVTARSGADFAGMLTNPESLTRYRQLTAGFAQDLPIMERSLQSVVRLFLNLSTDALPFFHEANVWVNNWTRHMADQSESTSRVQSKMQGLVTSAKDWVGLLGAAGRTLKDLFAPGVQSGDSMVVTFTHTLDRWDAWLRNNPDKVRSFFRDGERGVSRIATIIGNLTKDVWQIFQAVSPILSRAEQFIQFASGLGGGSLALGGALLYGGYQGARGALGGRLPGAGSALSTFVMGPGPGIGRGRIGGGAVVGGAAAQATLGRASNLEVARGMSSSGAFLMGPASVGATAVLARRQAAADAALAGETSRLGALRDVLTLRGTRSAVSSGAGLLRGLTTAEGRQLATAGALDAVGAARGVAAGAARFAAPVAVISALLQGAQTPGGPLQKLGGAASGLSFGLVPQNIFQKAFGTETLGSSLGSPQFRQALGGLAQQASNVRTPAQMNAVNARVAQLHVAGFEMSPADRARLQAFLSRAATTAANNAGAQASNTWEAAFSKGLTTMGPQRSVTTMLRGMQRQLHDLGPAGAKAFASDTAAWAGQLQAADPKMEKPIQRLMDGIIGDVNRMNRHVGHSFKDLQNKIFYFNGQILTGSTKTWQSISDALVNPSTVAQEKLSGIWATIQAEAVDSLTQMGYSRAQARQIVTLTAKGGQGAANANIAVSQTSATGTPFTPLSPGGSSGLPKKNERGGMIPGKGLLDTMNVGGALAAPGEAWIANRHTMNDLSSATVEKFGKTAWQMIRDEDRPHSWPMTGARSSRTRGYTTGGGVGPVAGGSPVAPYSFPFSGSGWSWSRTDQGVDFGGSSPIGAIGPYQVTYSNPSDGWYPPAPAFMVYQLTGGPDQGKYIYVAEHIANMARAGTTGPAGQAIAQMVGGIEMGWAAGPQGHQIIESMGPGHLTAAGQDFHTFLMGLTHGRITGGQIGAGGGAVVNPISLKAPRTGLRGIPGAMGDQASRIMARGLQDKINARIGAGLPGPGSGRGGTGMATASWFDDPTTASGRAHIPGFAELSNPPGSLNFSAMGHLPMGELVNFYGPGWSITIPKVDVGAGGAGLAGKIREADFTREAAAEIPGMLAAGLMNVNWRDTGQRAFERGGGPIRWGGWNRRGGSGVTNGPTLFGAGERGKERVTITPLHGPGVGRQIVVNITGPVYARDAHEVEHLAQDVAGKILDALDTVGQGTSDSELIGAHG